MKKIVICASLLFVILLAYSASPAYSKSSQSQINACVACHTSDLTLKKLFIPPKVQASEGEG